MLVLRRKAGESLLIGDDVEIEVLAITAHGAKICIRAPKETVVLRKELKITQQQNEAAAQGLARTDFKNTLESFAATQKSIHLSDEKFESQKRQLLINASGSHQSAAKSARHNGPRPG
jgi:carbon storage regulator